MKTKIPLITIGLDLGDRKHATGATTSPCVEHNQPRPPEAHTTNDPSDETISKIRDDCDEASARLLWDDCDEPSATTARAIECANKIAASQPFPRTTGNLNRIMHPEPGNTPSRTSANGSPIPCFTGAIAGLPPRTPPSGRPLDRDRFAPKSPPGTSPLPSPRGAEGDS